MTHTPTPWSLDVDSDGEYTIRGANRDWVANDTPYYPTAPNEDDAAFIVKACNSHDRLVEALWLVRMSAGWDYLAGETQEMISVALEGL